MRVGFAGTPDFAVAALEAILKAGFNVPVVVTQPDRPKGRGLAVQAPPVKEAALRHRVPVLQPASLRSVEARAALVAHPLDVLVVAAYGLILPADLLAWPLFGAINIHASLLPRWRGAAPIQHAILAGDAESGVTIMQMDAGLDTGPMIERIAVPIAPRETAATLHDRLAAAGAEAIVRALQALALHGAVPRTPQPATGATYAGKFDRTHAAIEWSAPAATVDRKVRAFDPAPGAYTLKDGAAWKLWRALPEPASGSASPGTVVAAAPDGIRVACGEGQLVVQELQPPGGRRVSAAAVVAGRRVQAGDRFESPPHS